MFGLLSVLSQDEAEYDAELESHTYDNDDKQGSCDDYDQAQPVRFF